MDREKGSITHLKAISGIKGAARAKEYLPEYDPVYVEFFKRIIRYNKKGIRGQAIREKLRDIIRMTE